MEPASARGRGLSASDAIRFPDAQKRAAGWWSRKSLAFAFSPLSFNEVHNVKMDWMVPHRKAIVNQGFSTLND